MMSTKRLFVSFRSVRKLQLDPSNIITRSCSIRFFSSRRGRQFQLDALQFTVSPEEAYQKFESWAVNEQGLGPLLSVGGPIGSATVLPVYAPFYYFTLNVRFGGRSIPEPFKTAYLNSPNGVVHIPG